jgi:hypothetical protein
MIVAKQPKCAEGHELKPFHPLDVVSHKKASRMLAECNQCRKYRCKVEVIEKN